MAAPTAQRGDGQPADARLFLSYCHEDNDYLDGAIIRLPTTSQMSIGTSCLRPGGVRRQPLAVMGHRMADGTQLRRRCNNIYNARHHSRLHLQPGMPKRAAEIREPRRGPRQRPYPIRHLAGLPLDSSGRAEPSIVETIERYQYEDVSNLRDKDPKDSEYKARVRDLVGMIRRNVLEDLEKTSSANGGEPAVSVASTMRARAHRADGCPRRLHEKAPDELRAALEDLGDIQRAMNDLPAPQQPNIATLQDWCSTLEHNAEGPVRSMRGNLAEARQSWDNVCHVTKAYINASTKLDEMGAAPLTPRT